MGESTTQNRVIICFSPRDRDGKQLIVAHLAAVRKSIQVWSADEVSPGETALSAFHREAALADAALLLLSANFFASMDEPDFAAQVEKLLHLHRSRGLWLEVAIWRDCAWRDATWLTSLVRPVNQKALAAMSRARRDSTIAQIVMRSCRREGELNVTLHDMCYISLEPMVESRGSAIRQKK